MIILGITLLFQIPIFNRSKNMAFIRFTQLNFHFITKVWIRPETVNPADQLPVGFVLFFTLCQLKYYFCYDRSLMLNLKSSV